MIPRWVKVLVAADVVVLLAITGVFISMQRDDTRDNVVNRGLRGSRPPAHQRMPDLSGRASISPRVPEPSVLRGKVVLLVSTCMACPSGDVIGGALRRIGERGIPNEARVEIVAWQGDAAQWRRAWHIPQSMPVHVVTGPAVDDVKRTLGIGDNGFGYLYDTHGVWRASYAVQLLQADDVAHDMRAVAKM
ncbi:MAG: hypothetical protein JWN41_1148 [Thermoleophilia bacterium]|nr:hypothetical protein [Thermoleophilia bacterium]